MRPDQSDNILRSMEKGVLFTLNNAVEDSTPSEKLRVISSRDNETRIHAIGSDGSYIIHRNEEGTLIYSKIDVDETKYKDDVASINIIGFN